MNPVICEFCGQNPATIHITEVMQNDEKRTLHICEACASTQPSLADAGTIPPALANLVHGVRRGGLGADLRCPECGITFEEFRTKVRFGCPNDYEAFQEPLDPLLEKIHGAHEHTGRLPRDRVGAADFPARRLRILRRELRDAIQAEKYEDAARIRDEIREIEEAPAEPAPKDE